jgi:hypothetical protein
MTDVERGFAQVFGSTCPFDDQEVVDYFLWRWSVIDGPKQFQAFGIFGPRRWMAGWGIKHRLSRPLLAVRRKPVGGLIGWTVTLLWFSVWWYRD